MINVVTTRKGEAVQNPPVVSQLLNHPLAAWLWLPIRVWLGYQWLEAGWHKFTSAAWMQTGAGLKGFLMGASKLGANGQPLIHYAWYANFLKVIADSGAYVWFAKLVTIGEILVGIGLILGAFTGFAAFFGAFMNWNYLMAGTVSVNPMFLIISVTLILAWKVSGYVGLDHFLVPLVGGLWARGKQKVEKVPARSPKGAEA